MLGVMRRPVGDSIVMAGVDGDTDLGASPGWRWDVALSFAGAQRDYVGQVAEALQARGVRCFYDADEQIELWGKYLAEELPTIYGEQAAAVVVFVSAEYAARDWTRLERRAALARAVRERREYVLPARFDDTPLPGLLSDMVTVDLRTRTPQQFAAMIAAKLAALAIAAPASPTQPGSGAAAAGRPLDEVTDPFALEVHRPVQPENMQPGLPSLPAYVPRGHDTELAGVVRAAAEGSSGIAVLVGGSSTGKTRACWEALRPLRDQPGRWRLWHPIDPSRPEAALRELPAIGLRTVVWLNEAQFYLGVADGGLGERVAAGLRELLRDPARAPVLILATLWPQFWHTLTARPEGGADPHAQARELLAGRDITVPAAFTAAQLQRLSEAGDARLALAAAGARDGQVIQFLAGAPELLARYRNAPPAAAALIQVAMDARRLGVGPALPQAFLEAAAPGYLTGTEWDQLGGDEDWLEQALAYTAVPCKGACGPLTRVRPLPARSRTTGPGSRDNDEQLASGPASIAGGPLYRLADYLDQHGRHQRRSQIPPAGFWAAAADHAFPDDQAMLGAAAHARGLYRDAVQLHKNAAASGNFHAALYLANPPYYIRADVRPVRWAVAHVPLDDPYDVAWLLGRLREAGAAEQVTALLARDPAAHVSPDNPHAVAYLVARLREAGAAEQVTALLARDPAAHVSPDNPHAVAYLVARLREAGAAEQATALLARDPAAHAPLDHPHDVADPVARLREAGAAEHATALADRAADHISLDHPYDVAWLLGRLREAGAAEQATALADRAADHISLDDPHDVAWLLGRLREAGAAEQVTALLARDPAAHVSLDNPYDVAWLLGRLREAGAAEQVTALADRAADHIPLDNPRAVARLLGRLREAGAAAQVTALADRAADHIPLDNPHDVADLVARLREAGAAEQATALADRAADHAPLDNPRVVARLLGRLREAGAAEQATALLARDPAAHVSLDNPYDVAFLLARLREAGAAEQVTALAERAAHIPLDHPNEVAWLLGRLREAGAAAQVTALADRAADHIPLEDPSDVAWLLGRLRKAGVAAQATALLARDPAAHVSLDHPNDVAWLLTRLREAGAAEQATALAERLPGEGMFELFRQQEGCRDRFRFGREADGSPAVPWGWENLD